MRADIVAALGEFDATQANGEPPTTLVAGSAPGVRGVAVFCHCFHGGMHFRATPRHHSICFQKSRARVELRMAGQVVRREPPAGSLIIHPAGFDGAADADDSVDTLTVAIDRARLGLAAADPLRPYRQRRDDRNGSEVPLPTIRKAGPGIKPDGRLAGSDRQEDRKVIFTGLSGNGELAP